MRFPDVLAPIIKNGRALIQRFGEKGSSKNGKRLCTFPRVALPRQQNGFYCLTAPMA
jgi:hypothetical protein